jgi:hypothetical protein
MVLKHVPGRARLVVVSAPRPDPLALEHVYLDPLDMAAVPEGLEDGVGEPEVEEVLHRLFAQVVVDPEDLVLAEGLVQGRREGGGARPVVTEGLFYDEAAPGPGSAAPRGSRCPDCPEASLAEAASGRSEVLGRDREVVEPGLRHVRTVEDGGETAVGARILDIAPAIADRGGQGGPGRLVEGLAYLRARTGEAEALPEGSLVEGSPREADDPRAAGEDALPGEGVESREDLP